MAYFSFDSRDNHQKLANRGSTSITWATGFVFGQTDAIVTHSLGYFPNVRGYIDFSGDIWPLTENFYLNKPDIKASLVTTTSGVTLRSGKGQNDPVTADIYYRVYKDGSENQKLSFSTQERQERLVGNLPGSFDAASGTWTEISVAHGLGEACLAVMRWKESGGEWIDQDQINYSAGRANNTFAIAHCDATNVYVQAFNSYGTDKTIEYDVYLLKLLEDDGVLFDSREGTLNNFIDDSVDIELSGTLSSGADTNFTATIPHSKDDTLGSLYLIRSDDSSKEYVLPTFPTNLLIPSSGTNVGAAISTENETNQLVITVNVKNGGGTSATITPVTFSIRYATFVAKG